MAVVAACIAALVVYLVGQTVFETVENGNLFAILIAIAAAIIVFIAVNRSAFMSRRRDRL